MKKYLYLFLLELNNKIITDFLYSHFSLKLFISFHVDIKNNYSNTNYFRRKINAKNWKYIIFFYDKRKLKFYFECAVLKGAHSTVGRKTIPIVRLWWQKDIWSSKSSLHYCGKEEFEIYRNHNSAVHGIVMRTTPFEMFEETCWRTQKYYHRTKFGKIVIKIVRLQQPLARQC